jgi:hypothetical protein
MKHGGRKYCDAIVASDRLCAGIKRAGLPAASVLAEAAWWSRGIARSPPFRFALRAVVALCRTTYNLIGSAGGGVDGLGLCRS